MDFCEFCVAAERASLGRVPRTLRASRRVRFAGLGAGWEGVPFRRTRQSLSRAGWPFHGHQNDVSGTHRTNKAKSMGYSPWIFASFGWHRKGGRLGTYSAPCMPVGVPVSLVWVRHGRACGFIALGRRFLGGDGLSTATETAFLETVARNRPNPSDLTGLTWPDLT